MRLIRYILICCLIIGCLTGCEKQQKPGQVVPEMKIGMAIYRRDDSFIALLVDTFESYAREKGKEKNIKVSVIVEDGKGNQLVQSEQIDRLIQKKVDVLCVNIVDRTVAASIIDKAKAANIPLIFFNREPVKEDLERWSKVYYVGAVARDSGILQGNMVIKAYEKNPHAFDKNGDGKVQYVMLEGEQGHQDALLRTEYAVKTIVGADITMDKLANDTANWHRSQSATKMTQWISEFGDGVELVLCNNDEMALGVIDAYKNAGMSNKLPFVVGIDGIPAAMEALEEGTMLGTVKNDFARQGSSIFQLCYSLVFQQPVETSLKLLQGKYVFISYTPVEGAWFEQE